MLVTMMKIILKKKTIKTTFKTLHASENLPNADSVMLLSLFACDPHRSTFMLFCFRTSRAHLFLFAIFFVICLKCFTYSTWGGVADPYASHAIAYNKIAHTCPIMVLQHISNKVKINKKSSTHAHAETHTKIFDYRETYKVKPLRQDKKKLM